MDQVSNRKKVTWRRRNGVEREMGQFGESRRLVGGSRSPWWAAPKCWRH